MKRILTILLLLSGFILFSISTATASSDSRPFSLSEEQLRGKKVALVLCGGGAKGAAHIGVLKMLE